MKLRIKGDSVRLRLTIGDVEQLGRTGRVEETLEFGSSPGQRFAFALSSSDDIDRPTVDLGNNSISVRLPRNLAGEWGQTDRVSISGAQAIAGGKTLYILIEKDFACLKERPGEDDKDSFPNPLSETACQSDEAKWKG
ncbi:hypothetical protein BH24ACI3_BH24ACI3_02550 [soil metagenome]